LSDTRSRESGNQKERDRKSGEPPPNREHDPNSRECKERRMHNSPNKPEAEDADEIQHEHGSRIHEVTVSDPSARFKRSELRFQIGEAERSGG
jgi:hypothetical protein